MFQQFKNIFPAASLNIRSITESVGINDSEWNRGVERMEALKTEFQNLNSIFSNRIDSQDVGTTSQANAESGSASILELKATSKTIEKIQEGWQTLHSRNKDNYEKAQIADIKLRSLQTLGQQHYSVCHQMENASNELTNIQTDLDHIKSTAAQLLSILSNLEDEIDRASVHYEASEFESWKAEQDQELIEDMVFERQLILEKEAKLKQQYEEYDTIQKKKRIELYEANFNAELDDYRRRRETEVSSLYSHKSNTGYLMSTSLNQLQLETDKNNDVLDNFLGGSTKEEFSNPKTVNKEKEKKKSKKKSKLRAAPVLESDDDSDNNSRVEILKDEDYTDF